MMIDEKSKRLVAGKKLLVLGAGPNEITLVRRAQELGCTVYVTDNNADRSLSPCKEVADVAWDISWSDTDALEAACREAGIDGVTAGYSEFRIENVIKLTERLGLPCYCTMEQLDVTRDKVKFKQACREAGVPTVREYPSPEMVDSFPVIVKPVDRAGSIGVGIAGDREELGGVYAEAMEASVSKHVIIEDYICDGSKFDSYYMVLDGEINLVSSDDVIFAKGRGERDIVQSAWLFPSRHHNAYVEKIDPAVRRMISNLGIRNGYLFVSAFARESGDFVVFETGFRLCGGHLYNYFERKGLPNTLDLFILHALTGSVSELGPVVDLDSGMRELTLNFYAKAGRVALVSGFDEMAIVPECCAVVCDARVGQVCRDDKAILPKLGLLGFCSDDPVTLKRRAEECYSVVRVLGDEGEDLIYDRIDPSAISTWWNG